MQSADCSVHWYSVMLGNGILRCELNSNGQKHHFIWFKCHEWALSYMENTFKLFIYKLIVIKKILTLINLLKNI